MKGATTRAVEWSMITKILSLEGSPLRALEVGDVVVPFIGEGAAGASAPFATKRSGSAFSALDGQEKQVQGWFAREAGVSACDAADAFRAARALALTKEELRGVLQSLPGQSHSGGTPTILGWAPAQPGEWPTSKVVEALCLPSWLAVVAEASGLRPELNWPKVFRDLCREEPVLEGLALSTEGKFQRALFPAGTDFSTPLLLLLETLDVGVHVRTRVKVKKEEKREPAKVQEEKRTTPQQQATPPAARTKLKADKRGVRRVEESLPSTYGRNEAPLASPPRIRVGVYTVALADGGFKIIGWPAELSEAGCAKATERAFTRVTEAGLKGEVLDIDDVLSEESGIEMRAEREAQRLELELKQAEFRAKKEAEKEVKKAVKKALHVFGPEAANSLEARVGAGEGLEVVWDELEAAKAEAKARAAEVRAAAKAEAETKAKAEAEALEAARAAAEAQAEELRVKAEAEAKASVEASAKTTEQVLPEATHPALTTEAGLEEALKLGDAPADEYLKLVESGTSPEMALAEIAKAKKTKAKKPAKSKTGTAAGAPA